MSENGTAHDEPLHPGSVEEPSIATPAEATIDDARTHTRAAFADHPDADPRADGIPAFYRSLADFHCRYRPCPRRRRSDRIATTSHRRGPVDDASRPSKTAVTV